MNIFFRSFLIVCGLVFSSAVCHAGMEMAGNASVNITSDTSSNAKNMAFHEARRQITTDVLSNYADAQMLKEALAVATDDDLTNLIASTEIDGERLSSTTYSANIKMTLNETAAKKWLDDNSVQNWLGGSESADKLLVMANLPKGLSDWIEINNAARAENTEIDIKRISGSQVIAEIPAANRSMFTIALREMGWAYAADDAVLRIWK